MEQAEAPVPKRSHRRASPQQEAVSKPQHLFEVVRAWSALDQQELDLPATKQRRARQAQVVISYGALRLLPPEEQQANYPHPLVGWVVPVWEPQPPAGVEPLEWVLLTSLPIQTLEQAWERGDWYRVRWIVEDYHQGLKTGCRIEQRQVQSYEGLRRLLGLLAPNAVRLLQLRAAARESPQQPVVEVLPADVVQVVATLAQLPAATLTTQQCWHIIAGYGGYLGRTGDGPPGWKTLWKGWLYIQAVLEGVHLAARLALDSSSDP